MAGFRGGCRRAGAKNHSASLAQTIAARCSYSRLEDRHLSLDLGYVWVDCLAFDRFAHHSNMEDRISLQRGLNLYSGHFLLGETASWAVTFRSRLHAQYLIMVERLGAMREQENDWSGAVDCYLRAIEIDPVAETIYCRLMNSYIRLGRHAEAVSAYRRCRQSLLTHLGISPTQGTQMLYQKLANS